MFCTDSGISKSGFKASKDSMSETCFAELFPALDHMKRMPNRSAYAFPKASMALFINV